MRRWIGTAAALFVAFALAQTSAAQPALGKLPSLSGSGEVKNYNSVSPYESVKQTTKVLFSARALLKAVEVDFPPFAGKAQVFTAAGMVQATFIPENDPLATPMRIRGRVVCIANLGLAGDIDGDDPRDDVIADPAGSVWEVRFEITQVDGRPPQVDGASLQGPIFGSFFFQDGGKADFADESFAKATLFDGRCAVNPYFGLEPFLKGNVVVRAK